MDKDRAYGLRTRNALLGDPVKCFAPASSGKVDRSTFPSICDASPSSDEDCGPLTLRLVLRRELFLPRSTD